jgi:ketosteroid isomerase-like protein
MSAANIEFVQSLYAAFSRGDIAIILAGLTPDADWESVGRSSDYPTFGPRKGRAGVQEFFRLVAEQQEVIEFSPKEFHASGDRVFVLGHYAWAVKKTARKVASDWVHVFTIKHGKVAKFREFTDTAKFAEAFR